MDGNLYPTFLICDEPTGSLDYKNREDIWKNITLVQQNDRTIILVSHDHQITQFTQHGKIYPKF